MESELENIASPSEARLAELLPKYLPRMENKVEFYRTFRRFSFVVTHVKGKRILDVGTGHGLLIDLLSPKYSIIGIDTNPRRDKVIRMDAQDLGFEENVFDTVIMAEVLEHLKYPLKGLREVYRVLKPNGRLILTTRNLWFMFYFRGAYRKKRLKAFLSNVFSKYWNEAEARNGWHLRFRPDYLLKLIRKANFQIYQFRILDLAFSRPFLRFTRILDENLKLNLFGACLAVVAHAQKI